MKFTIFTAIFTIMMAIGVNVSSFKRYRLTKYMLTK